MNLAKVFVLSSCLMWVVDREVLGHHLLLSSILCWVHGVCQFELMLCMLLSLPEVHLGWVFSSLRSWCLLDCNRLRLDLARALALGFSCDLLQLLLIGQVEGDLIIAEAIRLERL